MVGVTKHFAKGIKCGIACVSNVYRTLEPSLPSSVELKAGVAAR